MSNNFCLDVLVASLPGLCDMAAEQVETPGVDLSSLSQNVPLSIGIGGSPVCAGLSGTSQAHKELRRLSWSGLPAGCAAAAHVSARRAVLRCAGLRLSHLPLHRRNL